MVTLQLTRRDLSNWDPASQNWVVTALPKTIYVGDSSRNFSFTHVLNAYEEAEATGAVAGFAMVETVTSVLPEATY